MSGTQLVAALERVGYPGVEYLDGAALDWMFENPRLMPLLEWLCEEVGPNNVLTPAQRHRFAELEESGEVILEGEQLETALRNTTASQPGLTQDALRQEIAYLEEENRLTEQNKHTLVHHRNKLSLHHTALAEKTSKCEAVEKQAASEYRAALEQTHADNAKMNESLSDLTKSVSDLTSLYNAPSSRPAEEANQEPVFLSMCDLSGYHAVEEKFTQELTAYTKKLFFEGIAAVSGQGEETRYDILEVSNPESLLVTGERQNIRLDDCRELARLQAFYPASERERLNSQLAEQGMLAACMFTESKLAALKDTPYPKELKHLRDAIQETESVLTALKREEARITERELPRLITDCAASQVTKILSGDYNLKISRQDYFISNQDKVMDQLVTQRARNELLTMAYEEEHRCHRDTHRLLTATTILLQRSHRHWSNRMALMKEPSLQANRHKRSTVHSRDTYLANLHSMLGPTFNEVTSGKSESLFVTYDAIKSRASSLKQHVTSHRTLLAATNSTQNNRLALLERHVGRSEDLVYCSSTTSEGRPSLSPQQIADSITQLDALLGNLEQVVVDVMKDVDSKKKAIKSDSLLALERELMVCFHGDQKRLRRIMDELSSRVQAQMVT